MSQRVVVPLDGSEAAEAILRLILAIAGPLDYEVCLLRVVPAAEGDASAVAAATYLDQRAEELVGKGVRVRTEVRHGEPAAEIVAAAREVRASVIAMTTRGRGGFSRLLLGSVAEAVLRAADIPVFLFRYVERPARGSPAIPARHDAQERTGPVDRAIKLILENPGGKLG
jgi:nucleotide-binding universal stress UspA family protein